MKCIRECSDCKWSQNEECRHPNNKEHVEGGYWLGCEACRSDYVTVNSIPIDTCGPEAKWFEAK